MRRLVVIAALILFVPPAGAQRAAKDERAMRAHYEKGARYFKAAQYPKALVEYRAAYRLVPRPELLFNIARALHENGDRQEALDHYRRYLAEGPPGPVADEAREFAASLEKQLRTVEPAAPAVRAPPAAPPPAPAPEPAPEPAPAVQPPSPTEPTGPPTAPATVARPAGSRLRGGGFAGLTFASFSYEDWDGGVRVGLAAGGFASFVVAPVFALRLEAAYLQKGSSIPSGFSEPWHSDYLQAALLAQAAIGRFNVALGPYAGLLLATENPVADAEELNSLDAGVLAGAGVVLPLGPGDLTVDLRYAHGLTKVKPDVNGSDANRVFFVVVGYATRGPASR